MNKNRKIIKGLLYFLMLIASGFLLYTFAFYHPKYQPKDVITTTKDENIYITIDNLHQVAVKDGVKEWVLDAASAQLIENSTKETLLNKISVTFYVDNNKELYLTAEHGKLNVESKDIEVYGKVIVKNETFSLNAEKINYIYSTKIIYSNLPVAISGDSLNIRGDSMIFDLKSNKTFLEGKVDGVILSEINL
ncbi:MAG: LPS export ABC transporter periplasmic protein LptC [Desulfobacterales bacterium]|nr:LPS export ABC transporter periplasmic protein LptC [Desulfobacterales bacterium]